MTAREFGIIMRPKYDNSLVIVRRRGVCLFKGRLYEMPLKSTYSDYLVEALHMEFAHGDYIIVLDI